VVKKVDQSCPIRQERVLFNMYNID